MNFLGIDVSSKKLVLAARHGETVKLSEEDCGTQHSVRLMEEIGRVFKEADFCLRDCDFLACVVGPGSFTGIRVGISTVKGLCFAAEKPALAVTSLDVLAYAEREREKVALVDAGHGHVYAQGYGKAEFPAGFYALEEAVGRAEAAGAVLLSSEPIPGAETKIVRRAEGLLAAADLLWGRAGASSGLSAVYLRKSNAEEGR